MSKYLCYAVGVLLACPAMLLLGTSVDSAQFATVCGLLWIIIMAVSERKDGTGSGGAGNVR